MFYLKQINVITGGPLGAEGPEQLPPLNPALFVQLTVHFLMKQNEKNNIHQHYIDAEVAVYVHKFDVILQSIVGVAFLCLLSAFLPSLTTVE